MLSLNKFQGNTYNIRFTLDLCFSQTVFYLKIWPHCLCNHSWLAMILILFDSIYYQSIEVDMVSCTQRVTEKVGILGLLSKHEIQHILILMVILYHEEYSWDRNKETRNFVWGRLMWLRLSTNGIHSLHLVIFGFKLGTECFLEERLKLPLYQSHTLKKIIQSIVDTKFLDFGLLL